MARSKSHDVTVYIGRFSPFHLGHAHVLSKALETSKIVVVLVGSTGLARSIKNPFTFEQRETMITRWLAAQPNEAFNRVIIAPIRDYPYNDALWARQVQRTVRHAITRWYKMTGDILSDIALTGSDRDDTTWYLKSFPQWDQALVEPYTSENTNVSATEIREWLFSQPTGPDQRIKAIVPPTTMDFLRSFSRSPMAHDLQQEFAFINTYRKGWEVAPYAPTFVTVDAVVVQSGHVLLVRRRALPGKGLWALPGGFLNQRERLLDGAIRELMEETGIRLAQGNKAEPLTRSILKGSVRDTMTFDAPDRELRGRTITTAFLIRLDDTRPLPKVVGGDDAAEAKWVPIDDALNNTSQWYADHHAIFETLLSGKDI